MKRSDARRDRREKVVAPRPTTEATEPSVDAERALSQLSTQQRAVVFLTYWRRGNGTVRGELSAESLVK